MKKIIRRLRKIFSGGPPLVVFPVLIAGLLISAAFLKIRGQVIVAKVNGERIYRWELVRELEKNYGSQVLDTLVTKKLVYQQARKAGVSVTGDEVAEEMGSLEQTAEAQGATLDQVLGARGVDRESLEEAMHYQLLVRKMADTDVSVSDEEVDEYWESNKARFAEGAKKEDVVEAIRASVSRQKTSQKITEWMRNLRDGANIKYLLSF